MRPFVFLTLILGMLTGCAGIAPRVPVPVDIQAEATIPGHDNGIRALGLGKSDAMQRDFVEGLLDGGQEQACDFEDDRPIMCVLALSGILEIPLNGLRASACCEG